MTRAYDRTDLTAAEPRARLFEGHPGAQQRASSGARADIARLSASEARQRVRNLIAAGISEQHAAALFAWDVDSVRRAMAAGIAEVPR
jgi:hypothetical protein